MGILCGSAKRRGVRFQHDFGKEQAGASGKKRSLLRRVRNLFFVADSEGGALVEMAVTLPVIMAVMTGIFSFSIALYQKLQLAEAVSSAGHMLATDRGDNDPCTTATNAIYAAAPGLSQSKMSITYTLNGHNYGTGTTSCAAGAGVANANMVANGTAQIQATYTCTLSVYGMRFTGCSVTSQLTENVQ